MRWTRLEIALAATGVAAAVGGGGFLIGSSGGTDATAAEPSASVCVDALDAADAGFTALADQVRTVQTALREAFAGNPRAANRTLSQVQQVSPDEYKRLEADCRAAVAP